MSSRVLPFTNSIIQVFPCLQPASAHAVEKKNDRWYSITYLRF